MIRAIHHPAICTADADRAIAFYRDLFGCAVVYDEVIGGPHLGLLTGRPEASMRCVLMRKGPGFFEIQQYLDPESRMLSDPEERFQYHIGLSHVCFDVIDCKSEYERLRDAGMRFQHEPITAEGIANVAYGRDPDGNLIELQEILDPAHPLVLDL